MKPKTLFAVVVGLLYVAALIGSASSTSITADTLSSPVPTHTPTPLPRYGTIVVHKLTWPDGGLGFGFTHNISPGGSFVLGDGVPVTLDGVPIGSYIVTEEDPSPAYDLVGIYCDDGGSATPSISDPAARTATINLDPGETVNCTFTNIQRGTVIVEKQTDPDGAAGSFDFVGTPAGILSDNGSLLVSGLQPGTYTTTEQDPGPGFDLTGITCDDGGSDRPSTGDLATRTATFRLDPGETVRCTFTNTVRNQPPVANDDSYSTGEDTTLNEATPGLLGNGVLVNDTDADGDPLTAVLNTNPSHGSLTAFNSDGSFIYQPDGNYCGPDSFTYHANDGQADSNVATVDIDVDCIDDPPEVQVGTTSQMVQYSDSIAPVIVTATDVDSSSLSLSHDAPSALSTTGTCTPSGSGTSCTWTLAGQVLVSANTYNVSFTVSDATTGVPAGTQIIVEEENATVAFDGSNPVAVQVASPGGASEPFSLTAYVTEKLPDLPAEGVSGVAPGDISRANVTLTLVPVGPGGNQNPVACTSSIVPTGYAGQITLTCDFTGVPVNTYTVQVVVDGGYYGEIGEDVLVVVDPSLGFTTGGGWFPWPDTGDRTNFGYTMKYNKKGTKVKGSLLLIRHLPDDAKYRIKSNALYGLALGEASGSGSYGWASFSGKATYLAPGMIEAEGNHRFTAYVEDRGQPGAGADRFWLQVRDKDGNVVAELSLSPGASTNAIEISGGNIVVPHGGGNGKRAR